MRNEPWNNQLDNRNYLSPVGFKFVITKAPKADFFSNSANIPGINLGFAQQPTYLKNIPVAGDKLVYEDFNLTFFVDEDLVNYMQVHNWLKGLGFPESIQQFIDLKNGDEYTPNQGAKNTLNEYSDGTLIIYNSNFKEISKVHFKDVFPVSLSTIEFDATAGDINYIVATATFKYSIYNIEVIEPITAPISVSSSGSSLLNPTVTLTSTVSGNQDPSQNFNLQYTSSNVSTVSIDQGVGVVSAGSGTISRTGSVEAAKAVNIDSLTSSITYTITGVATNGTTVTASHTVTFLRPQTSVNRVCIAVIDESMGDTYKEMEERWVQFRANWPDRHFYLLQPSNKTSGGMYGTSIIDELHVPPSFLEQTDPDSTTVDTEPPD